MSKGSVSSLEHSLCVYWSGAPQHSVEFNTEVDGRFQLCVDTYGHYQNEYFSNPMSSLSFKKLLLLPTNLNSNFPYSIFSKNSLGKTFWILLSTALESCPKEWLKWRCFYKVSKMHFEKMSFEVNLDKARLGMYSVFNWLTDIKLI